MLTKMLINFIGFKIVNFVRHKEHNDIVSNSNFKGFENPKDANRFDPNKNFGKPIQFKREKEPSGKNYTGKAKVIYTYPNGIQVDVKNSEGPVAVVQQKLSRIKSQSTKDAPFYSIKYETL